MRGAEIPSWKVKFCTATSSTMWNSRLLVKKVKFCTNSRSKQTSPAEQPWYLAEGRQAFEDACTCIGGPSTEMCTPSHIYHGERIIRTSLHPILLWPQSDTLHWLETHISHIRVPPWGKLKKVAQIFGYWRFHVFFIDTCIILNIFYPHRYFYSVPYFQVFPISSYFRPTGFLGISPAIQKRQRDTWNIFSCHDGSFVINATDFFQRLCEHLLWCESIS